MRTRSRHDCSFVPGTPFLAGATTFAPSKLSLFEKTFFLHPIVFYSSKLEIENLLPYVSTLTCPLTSKLLYSLPFDAVP